jgi:hypothetical protein
MVEHMPHYSIVEGSSPDDAAGNRRLNCEKIVLPVKDLRRA